MKKVLHVRYLVLKSLSVHIVPRKKKKNICSQKSENTNENIHKDVLRCQHFGIQNSRLRFFFFSEILSRTIWALHRNK